MATSKSKPLPGNPQAKLLTPAMKAAAKRKADAAAKKKAAATTKYRAQQVASVKKAATKGGYTNLTGNNARKLAAARKAVPPVVTSKTGAVTKPKTIDDYLKADPDYMLGLSNLGTIMTDFQADKLRKEGVANVDYQTQLAAATEANKKAGKDISNSYAARGLTRSGVYGTAQGEAAKLFNTQKSGLLTNRTNLMNELRGQQTQLQSAQSMQKQQLRQQAIARRAAKLGQL